jgi:hypothetical protein
MRLTSRTEKMSGASRMGFDTWVVILPSFMLKFALKCNLLDSMIMVMISAGTSSRVGRGLLFDAAMLGVMVESRLVEL